MSNATSTASMPSASISAATASSSLATHGRFQYVASASTYGPWDAIQGAVPG
jgi:hypothetical protein